MADQYLSELVCSGCGHTGHVTWEGTGDGKRAVNMSAFLELIPGHPPTFRCLKCDTSQMLI